MSNSIVIDLGYGDSGKGLTVDWLASSYEFSTVARYCGGSQCGHGVRHSNGTPNGLFHEFQTWGAGTMHGINTILLPKVVFDPILIWKEYLTLKDKIKSIPLMFIHPNCPIITPYDVYLNQNSSKNLENGTCGRGIFVTKQREKNHHHIHAIDLLYPEILKLKLDELKKAYKFPIKLENGEYDVDLTEFYHCIKQINKTSNFRIVDRYDDLKDDSIIFESSQGLMLDECVGIFPHCTPSKVDIPEGYDFDNIYIVTRAYHTRHGNGPFTTEKYPITRSKWETNGENAYQGAFRLGILDLDTLTYSLSSSNIEQYLVKNPDTKLNLVITHLDVVRDSWKLMIDGKIIEYKSEYDFIKAIIDGIKYKNKYKDLKINNVFINDSPFAGNMKEFKYDVNIKQ